MEKCRDFSVTLFLWPTTTTITIMVVADGYAMSESKSEATFLPEDLLPICWMKGSWTCFNSKHSRYIAAANGGGGPKKQWRDFRETGNFQPCFSKEPFLFIKVGPKCSGFFLIHLLLRCTNEACASRAWYQHCRKWMFWVHNLHPERAIHGNVDITLWRHLPHSTQHPFLWSEISILFHPQCRRHTYIVRNFMQKCNSFPGFWVEIGTFVGFLLHKNADRLGLWW